MFHTRYVIKHSKRGSDTGKVSNSQRNFSRKHVAAALITLHFAVLHRKWYLHMTEKCFSNRIIQVNIYDEHNIPTITMDLNYFSTERKKMFNHVDKPEMILTIISNKCWKWISFHLPTTLTVFWLCKFFKKKSKLKLFSLNFLFNFACSLQRAIVLLVIYFWENTWSFLMVWVILCSSIKGFVEKNILVAVKNWWSLTFGEDS